MTSISTPTQTPKNILLGISGSIAAYKAPDLVRRLRDQGFEIRVVMTESAKQFVTPMALQTVSGHAVPNGLFDPEFESQIGHIELARWADCILIAPASADTIARVAHGHANDLLSTLILATTAPIIIAPAMNQQMWANLAVRENCLTLRGRGMCFLGPAVGEQACGEFGEGRMLEPEEIAVNVKEILSLKETSTQSDTPSNTQHNTPALKNYHVIITAGPTREKIDPVRYLSNYSSGKMGYALAEAAQKLGAKVTLISGPTALTPPTNTLCINVESAVQMLVACHSAISGIAPQHQKNVLFISAAAVADFAVENIAEEKIKKTDLSSSLPQLTLQKNPDIIADIAETYPDVHCIGFAAETQNVIEYAKEKRDRKKLAMIIANDVSQSDIGFEADENAVCVIYQDEVIDLPKQSKLKLAYQLLTLITNKLLQKETAHEFEKSSIENS